MDGTVYPKSSKAARDYMAQSYNRVKRDIKFIKQYADKRKPGYREKCIGDPCRHQIARSDDAPPKVPPIDIDCAQKMWESAGCTDKGTLYPDSSDDIRRWATMSYDRAMSDMKYLKSSAKRKAPGAELRCMGPKPKTVFLFDLSPGSYHLTFAKAKEWADVLGCTIATDAQMTEAYQKGANWCHFAWTMASGRPISSFPMQKKVKGCGNKGVNTGTMSKKGKLGVNLYGPVPDKEDILPHLPKGKAYTLVACPKAVNPATASATKWQCDLACQRQLWKSAGCTTQLDNIDEWWGERSPAAVLNDMKSYKRLADTRAERNGKMIWRERCYGKDK
jgi:hypothetical protein